MDAAQHTNDLGMAFVSILPGSFTRGSSRQEPGHETSEAPRGEVRISRAFRIGVYQVTQEQYAAVMASNPSRFDGCRRPVERVSWHEAAEFCRRLSEREGRPYRLPSEAEWEYVCRAGSATAFCFGDEEGQVGHYAWYGGNSGESTREVGLKRPNAWGLFDVHGNVWEWCLDWYAGYEPDAADDPTGPPGGTFRVVRGGSYFDHPSPMRCASRGRSLPSVRADDHGFRVVLAQVP
jgi:formylglycine-generating enzyme required for sulfatase activity